MFGYAMAAESRANGHIEEDREDGVLAMCTDMPKMGVRIDTV